MSEDRLMVRVQRTGGVGLRRDWAPYLSSHQEVWRALSRGEEVDFPEDEIALLKDSVGRVSDLVPDLARPQPGVRRVVKDNSGNTYHDGVLVDGPAFREQVALAAVETAEASSGERLREAQEKNEAWEKSEEKTEVVETEVVETEEPKTEEPKTEVVETEEAKTEEGSPSTDEVTQPRRPKRRRKK